MRSLPSLLAASLLAGCASVSDFHAARPLKRHGFAIMPHATDFSVVKVASNAEVPQQRSWGATAAYGVTDRLDAFVRGEFIDMEDEPGEGYLSLGAKLSLGHGNQALSLGYGQLLRDRYYEMTVAYYRDVQYHPRVFQTFGLATAVPLIYGVKHGEGVHWMRPLQASTSLTLRIGEHAFLRPQVGFNVIGLYHLHFSMNAGVAAGLGF